MVDERHPLYRLALKVQQNEIPTATIFGGIHRLDLRTDEFLQLQLLLPKGLPGAVEKSA